MENDFFLYIKMLLAMIIGWKLGRLERLVEDILNALDDLQKKKALL